MGEIKSVKVDNWGVFFLQKLQNFFNKTDYCDLTLQFRDNSQLKVHRLVLSACTDFFNVLEQTCELIDDALVMPIELQADVVVPIVNFMYTGTLEFELKMYNKLLNTAREMNMTVLLKLLEAHKRTMETTKTGPNRSGSPRTRKATASSSQISKVTSSPQTVSSTQQTQRSLLSVSNQGTPVRRRYATVKQMAFRENMQKIAPVVHRGPTRFDAIDPNNAAEAYEPSFDSMSYESRPLKEEPEDYVELQPPPVKQRSSPFEQLRKGYHNNKRPAVTTLTSPPAKKPNIEDVKEFSEQQRMRKQIAAEYGEDAEYDGVMDDDIHNDDDEDEPLANQQSVKKQTQQQKEKQVQPQASIIIKQSPNEKPTIVVKDNSNSKMDHAKIISEVLRQYPHLVKSNKNIKLKIMPNVGGQPQKITVRKEDLEQNRAAVAAQQHQVKQTRIATIQKQATLAKVEAQTSASVTSVETVIAAASNATTNTASLPAPKRRIDSKTMHALIAQGAENTTGPWLCLRCGVNGRPISIPSYRGFRRHLINTHKESIDPALCEHCGWRSSSNRVLGHHLLVEHKIPSAQYKFPKCDHCTEICVDQQDLDKHIDKVHPDEHKQQCIYCNKVFMKEMQLYNHMKTFHRKIAREDNVIDFSEDEMGDFDEELTPQATTSTIDKKIKIISDISLPSTILKLEEIPGAAVDEDYANDSGPKFVNADGNEMLLTAEQREEIMSQLDQDHDGGVVMVLNESAFPPDGESVVVGEETKIDSTENADVFSGHHIYSDFPTDAEGEAEFAIGHDTSAEESALDVIKGEEQEEIEEEVAADHEECGPEERMDDDHMEWAQNLISAHDADDDEHEDEDEHMDDEEIEAEEATAKKTTAKASSAADDDEDKVSSSKSPTDSPKDEAKAPKREDDISLKLKMLTGDWSDDEIEDDEDDGEENETETTSSKRETDAELAATLATDDTPDETTIEKPSPQVGGKEKESTIKKEAESTPPADDVPAVEEEIPQSTQSEPAEEEEEEDKAKPKEAVLEEDLSEENLTKAKQPESKTSETVTKADDKEKETQKSSPAPEDTKPRRTSAKEEAIKLEIKEENNSDDPIAEEPLESTTSPKKSDHLADAEQEKDETQTKADSNSDKEDTVTSTKEDSVKSVDKVKSLISEWADDDDDN